MKLIRFDGNKTGLVVELPSGIHVVDVIACIGALVPDDPISHGLLNGLLKDNVNWAHLIQHWAGSLCARLIALVAIVGKVISSADNVSIVKIIPTVRPATSSTSNLTAVPSVAVSKLISL